ncbi:NADAR family protein [Pedobacter rhizosphaerae]|nr:NADAR family protein [Pedobacter rhizosphaerae]
MEDKKNQIRRYLKGECITFRSTKGELGSLSNMAPGFPVRIGNLIIGNIETLYQACKYPKQLDIQKRILSASSPMYAKKISRLHSKSERPDWNSVRFKIMRFCLQMKLQQNLKQFSEILLSTKNMPIVEYTDTDKIWGAVDCGSYYEGVNALGRLLMELREKLNENETNIIDKPSIDNFFLLEYDLQIMSNYINYKNVVNKLDM